MRARLLPTGSYAALSIACAVRVHHDYRLAERTAMQRPRDYPRCRIGGVRIASRLVFTPLAWPFLQASCCSQGANASLQPIHDTVHSAGDHRTQSHRLLYCSLTWPPTDCSFLLPPSIFQRFSAAPHHLSPTSDLPTLQPSAMHHQAPVARRHCYVHSHSESFPRNM